jgi:hypothetical protein
LEETATDVVKLGNRVDAGSSAVMGRCGSGTQEARKMKDVIKVVQIDSSAVWEPGRLRMAVDELICTGRERG